jgi:hypothetical protein
VTSWSRPRSDLVSGSKGGLNIGNNWDSQETIAFFMAPVSSPRAPSAPLRISKLFFSVYCYPYCFGDALTAL